MKKRDFPPNNREKTFLAPYLIPVLQSTSSGERFDQWHINNVKIHLL